MSTAAVRAERTDRSERTAERIGARLRRGTTGLGRWVGSLRLLDMVLFALMLTATLPVAGDHASEGFLAAAIVLALFRRPRWGLGSLGWLVPVFVLLLTYVGAISLFQAVDPGAADWRLRLMRIAAVTVMALVTATGRLDLRSAIAGATLICAVNVPLFFAGLVPDDYGGYLTGIFGDKNFAGLVYATTGVLATSLPAAMRWRVAVWLAFLPPLWLTGSRTSIAAYLLAAVWMVVGARLLLPGKLVLGALSYAVVQRTAEDYSRVGVFSDRLGSDLLRARIDAASRIKVHETGFFGRGLGNAFVVIQDRPWFFHNSYWSAVVEGGWPWTVFVVGVTGIVLLRPFRRRGAPVLATSAGLGIVLLVTASRLGEVFYTVPWALALAFGMQAMIRASARPTEASPGEGLERGRRLVPPAGRRVRRRPGGAA